VLDRAVPTLLAVALGVTYAVLAPRTGDLPAHVFRAELFGREGITVWNGQWYSGHHTPAYSLLFPPLAWLVGPWVAGAVSAVAATALFEPLARRRFGPSGARAAAPLFALGMGATIFAGRLTFALGVAIGVGALLALEQRRGIPAAALAALSALASPVAGLFVALVGVTATLSADRARAATGARPAVAALVAVAALAPPALLAVAFPEGGSQPFVASSFLPALALVLAFALVAPRAERGLRVGALLYALAMTASFLIATPMGGNAVRLGQVAGAAVAAGALFARPLPGARRAAAVVLVGALLVWQITPAVRDLRNAMGEPSTEAAYFAPLLEFLERAAGPADRIEIPLTREHWEAAEVARRFPIARGWLRSTDIAANPIFYKRAPGHREYQRWLRDHAVRFVALADAPLDYSARAEGALVAEEPPYLRMRWRSEHWRVFEVTPRPGGAAPLRTAALVPDGAVLDASGPAHTVVRARWTPYWILHGGCVEAAGEWTRISVPRAGRFTLEPELSPARVGRRDARCSVPVPR
jgi:hypothetical protein